ncbi:tetratricopeptide repeat protein, partial [Kaarinaea lacus]
MGDQAKSASTEAGQSSQDVDLDDAESEYIADFELVDVPESPPPDPELVKVLQDDQYSNGRMAFLFGQYKAAYDIWLPLAEDGYAKAQATIAWMYHTGKGVKKDLTAAFEWYEKAAKQNHPIAQNNVGVFYEQGLSVGKSSSKAAKWYRESAEWGYPYAQYNLGTLYL